MSNNGRRDDVRGRWKATEERLAALVAQLGERIPERDRRNILHFSDHNEYGLAFEQIVLTLVEEHAQLNGPEFSEIESIYRYFGNVLTEVDDSSIASLRELVRA